MASNNKNKVRFGLKNVHWAEITEMSDDGIPTYGTPNRLPGAVSISFDAEGETEPFYADNIAYYIINNNAGYSGDLEVALIPTEFATGVLGEVLDDNGVLVESNTAEVKQFALLFEFDGDKKAIRHVLYCCSVSRPGTEGGTNEDTKNVATETLSFTASALSNGLVKSKTSESTKDETYSAWYDSVYVSDAAKAAALTAKASTAVKAAK